VIDVDGTTTDFEMTNPFAFLWVAAQKPRFAAILARAYAKYGSSKDTPWSLVLYVDEVTPGNDKKTDNKKKLQCIYFTFLEFDGDGISKEDFWITANTIRSKRVSGLSAGISAVVRNYLNILFDENSFNFHMAGIRILVEGNEMRIFAKFIGFLCDEAALHALWLCKGASGVKTCVQCLNVVNKNWKGAIGLDEHSFLKPYSTVVSTRELVPATKHTIWAILAKLESARPLMSASAFKEYEKSLGFNFAPGGILMDLRLRDFLDPSTQTIYDWPHSVLEGVLPKQLGNLHDAFRREHRVDLYVLLDEFVRTWHIPSRFSGCGWKDTFSEHKRRSMKEAGHFKATMSEGLCVVPIVAYWCRTVAVPEGKAPLACDAFIKLAFLISALQAAGRGSADVAPEDLRLSVEAHLEAYRAAHGDDMIPKFHHGLHYADAFRVLRVLPTTMPLERKHKTAKAFAEAIDNTSRDWDSHVLKECINKALSAYESADYLRMDAGLYNTSPPRSISSRGCLKLSATSAFFTR